jgi:hypothetical protein
MSDFTKALETELRREEEDFRDLMNDFEFVKELNKELSIKFQDFVDAIPKPEEIDRLIVHYNNQREVYKSNNLSALVFLVDNRLFQLRRFRSAAVLLQKDNINAKPMRYEDLFK